MATGLAHALLQAQHAWLHAPAAASALQQGTPLARRWQLLPTGARVVARQRAEAISRCRGTLASDAP